MFEARYQCFIANKLIHGLIAKAEKEFPQGIYSEKHIINKQYSVKPLLSKAVGIYIRLGKDDYYDILRKMNEADFDGNYVKEAGVQEWMTRCVVGRPTKRMLDE